MDNDTEATITEPTDPDYQHRYDFLIKTDHGFTIHPVRYIYFLKYDAWDLPSVMATFGLDIYEVSMYGLTETQITDLVRLFPDYADALSNPGLYEGFDT